MTVVAWPTLDLYLNTTSAIGSAADENNKVTNTNLRDLVLSFSTTRGRQNSQGHFDPGTATFELDNHDGRLDPTNTSSPFYPNLGPGNGYYLVAGGHSLFAGYADSYTPAYDYTGGERMIVQCSDLFKMLSLQTWQPPLPLAEQTPSARITQILADIGFTVSWLTGDTGNSVCVGIPVDANDPTAVHSEGALAAMQAAAEDTETGLLFMKANGTIQFYDRYQRQGLGASTAVTFGDGGGSEVEYEQDISPTTDDTLLVNGATVTDGLGQSYTYQDAASIAKYGPRFISLQTLAASPNEAGDQAAFLVQTQKDARLRFDGITSRPIITLSTD